MLSTFDFRVSAQVHPGLQTLLVPNVSKTLIGDHDDWGRSDVTFPHDALRVTLAPLTRRVPGIRDSFQDVGIAGTMVDQVLRITLSKITQFHSGNQALWQTGTEPTKRAFMGTNRWHGTRSISVRALR